MNERLPLHAPGDTSQFFRAIAAAAVAVLVLIGVGGTAYHLVSPAGWFATAYGRSLAGGLAALLALLLIGVCAWRLRDWVPAETRERAAELFAYGFAGAGLLYAADLFMKGAG
jgi:putative copper export protein